MVPSWSLWVHSPHCPWPLWGPYPPFPPPLALYPCTPLLCPKPCPHPTSPNPSASPCHPCGETDLDAGSSWHCCSIPPSLPLLCAPPKVWGGVNEEQRQGSLHQGHFPWAHKGRAEHSSTSQVGKVFWRHRALDGAPCSSYEGMGGTAVPVRRCLPPPFLCQEEAGRDLPPRCFPASWEQFLTLHHSAHLCTATWHPPHTPTPGQSSMWPTS